MALEVVIVIAYVTGRILVLPPKAVLYLLAQNKKWKDNFSSIEDFVDFARMTAGSAGVDVMQMHEFLGDVAARNDLFNVTLPGKVG